MWGPHLFTHRLSTPRTPAFWRSAIYNRSYIDRIATPFAGIDDVPENHDLYCKLSQEFHEKRLRTRKKNGKCLT